MSNISVGRSDSAEVRLWLDAGGRLYELSKAAPEHLVAREGIDLAPCDAELVMQVDGREHRWFVTLPDGSASGERRIRIAGARLLDRMETAAERE